jgi:hypothetical protein
MCRKGIQLKNPMAIDMPAVSHRVPLFIFREIKAAQAAMTNNTMCTLVQMLLEERKLGNAYVNTKHFYVNTKHFRVSAEHQCI